MCGIAGYKCSKRIPPHVLHTMVGALAHRGPDSEGYYESHAYNAGMRRLMINDLKTGDQPLYNQDRSVILFYNGEIYNWPQLRQELENNGYTFKTTSDGEVICHLYDEYGEQLFELLDGMFAIALWSQAEQKLILARDIPGEKPLYYAKLSDTEIVFASEIKSLKAFPGIDLNIDRQAVWDLSTFLWIPEPMTVYDSIKALPPSHFLVADDQGIHLHRYPNRFNRQKIDIKGNAVVEETHRVVTEAIYSRLLSDVPVGTFLSGGLDSSIITSVASKVLPSLKTFTIGFANLSDPYHGMADESEYAKAFAKQLGIEHVCIHVQADDFRKLLFKFCVHGDQPFSVSSGLGILSVAEAANDHGVKVLLSGDGADECFGGYSWYFHLDKIHSTKTSLLSNENEVSFQNFGLPLHERLGILKDYSPQKRAWAWHYYASEKEKQALFNPDYFDSVQTSLRFFTDFKPESRWDPEDYIRQDRSFYFPNEMLRKIDRMTMAYSVEGRAPFAAPSVLSHADKLSYPHLVKGPHLKWVLRKAFEPQLPQAICQRPKHGFNVPIDHWLKNEWKSLVDETFSQDSHLMKLGIIHRQTRSIAERMLHDPTRLNGHTIFSFIMLNMWLENHHGNHC